MTLHQRMPEDKDILDMIRAGINTVPDIAHKVYGYPATGMDWNRATSRVRKRLLMLEKYRIVRRTDRTTYFHHGIQIKVWEVIE